MEALASKSSWRVAAIDLETLAPKCSWRGCRRRGTRLQALLHRSEGVRCDEEWYCSSACLQDYLAARLHQYLVEPPAVNRTAGHRVPLGLILLSRGLIQHETLQRALEMQKSEGGRVGACLRRLSAVTEEQIASALARQWSCPVYPVSRGSECRHLVPRHLQEFHRMLPVHFVEVTRDLYLAFEQHVDYTALLAIEQMLACHTRPCVLPETEMNRRLSQGRPENIAPDIVFASSSQPLELARNICGYVQQVGADTVRLIGCGPHIWVRLDGNRKSFDLLVRRWQI